MSEDALRDALRVHHPIMRSETGPFSGCRCGGVRLGEDVIAHVVAELAAALDGDPLGRRYREVSPGVYRMPGKRKPSTGGFAS